MQCNNNVGRAFDDMGVGDNITVTSDYPTRTCRRSSGNLVEGIGSRDLVVDDDYRRLSGSDDIDDASQRLSGAGSYRPGCRCRTSG